MKLDYEPTFTEKVLEFLQERAEITVDLLNAMLLPPGEARRDFRRFVARGGPIPFKTDWAEWYRKRRIYSAVLSRLKKQGLVANRKVKDGVAWKITSKGMTRLLKIKKRLKDPLSLINARYKPQSKYCWTVVIYDIPEFRKKTRRWLQGCLRSLEFAYLQKSVWIGKKQLPEDFIDALKEREALEYVQIFAVKRGGTIENIS